MKLFTTIRIPLDQRAVLLEHGLPVRALAPGSHRFWGTKEVIRFDTDALVLDAAPAIRAVLPADWFAEATLAPTQRGVLHRDARPVRFLRPGTHRFWTVDPTVALTVLDVTQPVPPLTDELRAIIPSGELVDVTVHQHQRALKYVQGRFAELLGPGRHVFWSHPEAKVTATVLDMRLQVVTIQGQELMTRDKVTLRLTLTAEYAPGDPASTAHGVADAKDALYLAIQLAARDHVASVTLDELLEGRDQLTRALEAEVQPRGRELGLVVGRVGVKDVILPGEMKILLNKVIEAEKAAAANVIRRREEAAAMRSMANTARVVADHPMLLELKRLEALESAAAQVDELRLVVGADGLRDWLGPAAK